MKNIPPSILPNFYGMFVEYPNSLMFKFDILGITYGYNDDTHKLRLFPSTLKAATLKCFMGLWEHSITSWDEIKKIFLKKYQPIAGLEIQKKIFLECLNRKMGVWRNIWNDSFTTYKNPNNIL